MDKSRQRRYPTVKSNLNIVRESFITASSLLLWMYSLFAMITILFTLLDFDNYYVQLARIILKVEQNDIYAIFTIVLFGALLSLIYLILTYIFNYRRNVK